MSSERSLILLLALAAFAPAMSAQAATPPRCYTAELTVTPGPAQGAAGSIGQTVRFRNISGHTCTLDGYPGLQMRSASGSALATHIHRGSSVTVSARPVRLVTLGPGRQAAFDIGYAAATGFGNERCPASARVQVTPPNDFKPLTISWRLQPYGGSIPHLECGLINVSPVYTG